MFCIFSSKPDAAVVRADFMWGGEGIHSYPTIDQDPFCTCPTRLAWVTCLDFLLFSCGFRQLQWNILHIGSGRLYAVTFPSFFSSFLLLLLLYGFLSFVLLFIVYLCIHPIYISACLSVCLLLSVCPSVCLSVYRSIDLSIHIQENFVIE